MDVALVTGKGKLDLVQMPDPTPEPQKAVVEISYCGICGTDLHAYQSGAPYNPAMCGHEWTGTVRALGEGARGVKEGDRVGIGVAPACGGCAPCRAGDSIHCSVAMMGMIGVGPLAAKHGGFASAISIDASRLYPVRDGISDIQAAMLEPIAVCVHALRRTALRLGDGIVVVGAGPIGLMTLQCARAAGAGRTAVVEPDEARAEIARQLGADVVLRPEHDDIGPALQREFGPLGPDVVFECAGVPQTVQRSIDWVRRGGVVSLVGMATSDAQIAPGSWLVKEVRLAASIGYLHEEFDVAMQLVADGRVRTEVLHTDTVALGQIQPAFDALLSGGGQVKVLVDPRL